MEDDDLGREMLETPGLEPTGRDSRRGGRNVARASERPEDGPRTLRVAPLPGYLKNLTASHGLLETHSGPRRQPLNKRSLVNQV